MFDLCRSPSVFCSNSTNHWVLQKLFRIFVSSMAAEFGEIQITSEPVEHLMMAYLYRFKSNEKLKLVLNVKFELTTLWAFLVSQRDCRL